MEDVARECHGRPGVAALGINCTEPRFVESLIAQVRSQTDLPLLVYPNSGERYQAKTRTWHSAPQPLDWALAASRWMNAGAQGVGGCCRVGPDQVRRIRAGILSRDPEARGGSP